NTFTYFNPNVGLAASGGGSVSAFLGNALTLDNTTGNNVNRLGDAVAQSLTLTGGTLNYFGAANTASTENLGPLNVNAANGGNSQVTEVAGTGGSTALRFQTLTRGAGALLNFQAGLRGEQTFNTTTNVVTFTANPVVTNIIQGVTVTDAALVNQ